MPIPRFRAGRIEACPDLLGSIPRTAMIAAIVEHVTTEPGAMPIRTDHEHSGRAFYLETAADESRTVIRLTAPNV